MGSETEYMTECALSHLEHKDYLGHDAIMMAIHDPVGAKNKYPDQRDAIKNAIAYSEQELKSSGHSG